MLVTSPPVAAGSTNGVIASFDAKLRALAVDAKLGAPDLSGVVVTENMTCALAEAP